MSGDRGRVREQVAERALPLAAMLGIALAAPAVVTPGARVGLAAAVAVVLAGFLAYATRVRPAWVGATALLAHHAATTFGPGLPVTFQSRLVVEAVAAVLMFVAVAGLARHVATVDVRAHVPRTLLVTAGVAAFAGAVARLASIAILWRPRGDAHTILFALRYDAAASVWAFAGLVLAGAALARWFGREGASPRRVLPRVRAHAPQLMASMAIFLVVADGGAIAGTVTGTEDDLVVGYHGASVAQVPEDTALVHVEAAWGDVEKQPGERDWSRLDQEMALARERGMDVYLLANTYPPKWFTDARPESVMVDADGRPFHWIDEAPGTARKRIWDVSFADPVAVDAKRDFLEAAVARYGDDPGVKYVAVQNEPAYPVDWHLLRWASFDPFTVNAFRDHLHAQFDGDLARMNEELGTDFPDWEVVEPPAYPFGAFGEAWIRFREDLLVGFVTDQMDAARALTDAPVTAKIMGHAFTRYAEPQAGLGDRVYRKLADASDVVSVDLYPATNADLVRSLQYFREIAGEKELVVAEFNLALGLRVPGAGFRLVTALNALDTYADAVILFTADHHFVYGGVAETPAPGAVRLHKARLGDADYGGALRALLAAEVRNVVAAPVHVMDAAHAGAAAVRTPP